MADRSTILVRWWTTGADSRQIVLLALAYLAAIVSILSYVHFNAGTGMPTRLQMALMLLPIAIIFYLGLRSTDV